MWFYVWVFYYTDVAFVFYLTNENPKASFWRVFKDSVCIFKVSSIMYLLLLKKTFGLQFGWPQNVYCFVCYGFLLAVLSPEQKNIIWLSI